MTRGVEDISAAAMAGLLLKRATLYTQPARTNIHIHISLFFLIFFAAFSFYHAMCITYLHKRKHTNTGTNIFHIQRRKKTRTSGDGHEHSRQASSAFTVPRV